VYVNGVRMSTADVTVTSGDTVTFAEALADGDEVDIVGYGTFSVASLNADNLDSGTVPSARVSGAYTGITSVGTLTSFASTGIDDNASSTAMTLDSSNNLLVGTTNSLAGINNTDEGISLRTSTGSSSSIAVSRNTGISGYFNRNSDGDILSFRKDGSGVGAIGVRGGDSTYIESTASSRTGLDFSGGILPRYNGALSNGSTSLGAASYRFSDLYLSGGVYLGGTGSANYLDDYEEGTWTPIIRGSSSAGTGTYTTQQGTYTKIGNMVKFQAEITWTSHTGTGQLEVRNYPFTSTNEISPISLRFEGGPTFSSGSYVQAFVNPNSTTSGTAQTNPSTSAYTSVVISNTGTVIVNGVYKTS